MRPLKLRLVEEMPTSPFSNNPVPRPMQGPQLGGSAIAPALSSVCHAELRSASRCTHELAAPTKNFTPAATFLPRSTDAAASRSSTREFTQEIKYAFWMAIFFLPI